MAASPITAHVANIITVWNCEECDANTTVALSELPEIGTPICGNEDCRQEGADMILASHAEIKI